LEIPGGFKEDVIMYKVKRREVYVLKINGK